MRDYSTDPVSAARQINPEAWEKTHAGVHPMDFPKWKSAYMAYIGHLSPEQLKAEFDKVNARYRQQACREEHERRKNGEESTFDRRLRNNTRYGILRRGGLDLGDGE